MGESNTNYRYDHYMRGHDVRSLWLYNEIDHGARPGGRGVGW